MAEEQLFAKYDNVMLKESKFYVPLCK